MKIVNSINFVPFYDKIKNQAMSAPAAYRLSKIYKATKEDEAFYQEKLRSILFEYGELDENGNLIPVDDGKGIKIKADKQAECLAAIEELQNIESTIEFEPLPIELLENLEVTPAELESIADFLA